MAGLSSGFRLAVRLPLWRCAAHLESLPKKEFLHLYKRQLTITRYNMLHTTRPSRVSLNALAGAATLVIIRPMIKLVGIIFGRSLRKWWRSMPKHERRHLFREWYRRNRRLVLGALGLISSSYAVFYILHLEQVPLVKRRRFVPLTPYQYKQISDEEERMITNSVHDKIIQPNSALEKRVYMTVHNICDQILRSNFHLLPNENRSWKVILVDDPQANAFALPSGSIFIFSGLFNIVSNEHELAMVMAHEMAHVICGHGTENLTRATLLDLVMTVVLASLWCIMPTDGIASVATWFSHHVAEVLFKLPFSRYLEKEADQVGLDILSRACFDPRKAAVVWLKMDVLESILEDYDLVENEPSSRSETMTALARFSSTVATYQYDEDRVHAPRVDVSKDKKPDVSKLPTKTVDFLSTHPSSADRYKDICEVIASGGTERAALEGKCEHPELKKPLPMDYDSRRRLRTEILQSMKMLLRKKP